MTKANSRFGKSLYFMDDKNIRDGLLAQRVKVEHLFNILLDKGIMVPRDSTKEDLLDVISKVRFDYFDYCYLCKLLENPDRRDSQSTSEIPQECTASNVSKAFNDVKKSMIDNGVDLTLIAGNDGGYRIEANYVEVDYSKAPMRQRTRKKGIINIEVDKHNGETSIRFPATEVGKKFKSEFVQAISKQFSEPLAPIEIDYEYTTAMQRTKFFTTLIHLDGYEVFDVVNVGVQNNSDMDDEEKDFTGQVRKAVLSGEALLTSKIYDSFPSEHYHIYKIVWKIREINSTHGVNASDCFTVEAQFDDINKSKGFRYQVKSVQRYSRGSLNATHSNIMEKQEVDNISKLIFKTAVKIYTSMLEEV